MAKGFASITIANGAATSDTLVLPNTVSRIVVEAPAALTNTVTLHGSLDGATFKAMYSGGAAITLAANAIHTIGSTDVVAIRVVSAGNEGGTRAFGIAFN
jgi:hypothetical protein